MAPDPSSPEVLPWLKSLPLAPEYRPTLSEFRDPIAYILKIEPEASRFGICKIVPPLPAAPKLTAVANLNLSFSARSPSGDPTFTTRQQQIGFCPRRPRPVQKSVWQSGIHYTLPQFEAKARTFERAHLPRSRKKKSSSSLPPLEVETLYWKAAADKPFSVEYANDMPGSGFAELREEETVAAAENVGETAWNMRGVARSKGSLLRFMREEIPGVTSPMVYVAMMFSWFAWHVEDHELHSLNYLHMGAGKTWYGVPRDAALAFEDVIRVHGYGGEVNPLITFATLAEKTTVMSPEVLIGSGIPCCRLVQNAGEFVVTFPGSYHTGFSHGFNCGEASNISTPEWLKVAKEAAIRRASTNSPPMVSHYQLLYALSLSLFLRSPINMVSSPKSSRLKNKLRGVGETMIKETFVENMIQNNNLLSILLDDGSSCVILPQRTSDPLYSSLHLKLQMNIKPRIALGLCSGEDKMEGNSVPYLSMGSRSTWTRHLNGFSPAEESSLSVYQRRNSSMTKVSRFESSGFHHSTSEMQHIGEVQTNKFRTDGFLDKGLLSCVTCGILNYACVAVIQPREATAGYLMSTVFNSFANQIVSFEEKCDLTNDVIRKTLDSDVDINIGNREMIHSSHHVPVYNYDFLSDANVERGASALDLLASVYGDLSDSEEAAVHDMSVCTDGNRIIHSSPTCNLDQKSTCPFSSESISHNRLPSKGITFGNPNYQSRPTGICTLSKLVHSTKVLAESCYEVGSFSQLHGNCKDENVSEEQMWFLAEKLHDNIAKAVPNSLVDNSKIANNSLIEAAGNLQYPEARRDLGSTYEIDQTAINSNDMILKHLNSDSSVFHHRGSSNDSAITGNTTSTSFCTLDDSIKNSCVAIVQASDRDFSRMHVFCLEHAVEVEKRLRAIGGVNMLLLCHPEYPKMETEAKLLAKELGLKHHWKDVQFRNSTEQDQEKIRIAIDDEEVIPCNGDWTVKLGINLYYSVNLSKSPLFRKQLPYNEVIYKSFAQKLPAEQKSSGRVPRRQKKIILAGKWCGKVWMSNQVHPFLADLNITDHDEIDQKSDEVDRDIENENQSILPKRSSSNNSATARRKSSKKRKNLAFRSSTRKPSRTKLDKSSDTGYAEVHSVSADGDPDTDLKSEDDTDIEDEKQVIQPARNSANDSAAARMKSSKKAKILTVRSRTRKSAYTRLENSSDSGCGEEIFGYADDVPDTDQKSEADSYIEDEKKAILPRRNSTKGNAAARRISVKGRNKLAVSSSTRKHSHTRIDDSSDVGYAEENSAYADGDPELDQRLGDATDIENDTQAILPRRNSMNNNATVRRKSIKKRTESVVRSSTRKPAHTRLNNSIDTGYAEENPGYVDNDQVADQTYEDETDLESKKQEILPRGNLTNNNSTRRKSGRKRKRSTASCTRKPAHTRLDSSGGAGHAEVDSSAKSGRNLSCLRSTSKGSTRKPPSMRLRKQWLKSGEAKTIVAPEKCNKKKRLRKAPDSDPGKEDYPCDVEGCCMSFATKHDLVAHKRNVCPEKGCGKKFFSHKYLLQHQKVHSDDRPLKCPWKGCKMTFKWAWARTEHIRVHTGERPYVCGEPGCEQTFRFVSDFSRHRRKTGHCSAKKGST